MQFCNFEEDYKKLETKDKQAFIDCFLKLSEPNDLFYLNDKLEKYKKDFICLLPIEIVEIIFRYLDWQSLLSCCQVKYFRIFLPIYFMNSKNEFICDHDRKIEHYSIVFRF